MDQTIYIYALVDPRNGRVRYVGKALDITRRLYVHLADVTNTHKSRWIQSLRALDLKPEVQVLQILTNPIEGEWQVVEQTWIQHFRELDPELTNATEGGEGALGTVRSAEVCARLSQSKTGMNNPAVVLNENHVLAIRHASADGVKQADLAATYGVKRATISAIVTGRSWSHVGGPLSVRHGRSKAVILRNL